MSDRIGYRIYVVAARDNGLCRTLDSAGVGYTHVLPGAYAMQTVKELGYTELPVVITVSAKKTDSFCGNDYSKINQAISDYKSYYRY